MTLGNNILILILLPMFYPLSKGDLSLRSYILCTVGIFSLDSAKFRLLRILQSDKIGRNPMQYPTPQKYNPKRREKIVTKICDFHKKVMWHICHNVTPILRNQHTAIFVHLVAPNSTFSPVVE